MHLPSLSRHRVAELYRQTLSVHPELADEKAFVIYAKEVLNERLGLLADTFSSTTWHAVAIKANAEPAVLRYIVQLGHGLEAASWEEVRLALDAGCQPSRIVFDSPAKTHREIDRCHRLASNMIVNANCLEELERYPSDFNCRLGLRINPVVESDAPDAWNVSTPDSKFGVPLNRADEIVQAFLTYPNLTGLHVHIGSGIQSFEPNVKAVKAVVKLAERIEKERAEAQSGNHLTFIDIGGGLEFEDADGQCTLPQFVEALKKESDLFERYEVITEYGKFLHKHAAFAISDIEYVLEHDNDLSTAVIHLGADMFVRKTYSDLPVSYPIWILGREKDEPIHRYHIAGPLCFSGDYLDKGLSLPELKSGDRMIIGSCGANTTSMWSRHCNRDRPPYVVI